MTVELTQILGANKRWLISGTGQSNSSPGWSVLSGNRELLPEDAGDDRIRVFDNKGRGPELIANPDFTINTTGWTGTGCTLSMTDGAMVMTAASGGNPSASATVTTEVGETYEITADVEDVGMSTTVRLGSLTEVKGTRFSNAAMLGVGLTFARRAQFVASATSHTVTVSGTISSAGICARVKNISCRKVLSSGTSTFKAAIPIGADLDFGNIAAMGVEPTYHMAKRLLARGLASHVTLLPYGIGGTALVSGDWAVGGALHEGFKTSLTAALAADPYAIPVEYFGQGEADATNARSVDAYKSAFIARILDIRTVPGAENMRTIIPQQVPEYVASSDNHRRINQAHIEIANEVPRVHFMPMDLGYQKPGEAYHYRASGSRRLGTLAGNIPAVDWAR